MAMWDDGPDPYTYEKIGVDRVEHRPVYVVSRDGTELGVIEPIRESTDTKIKGTRLRRQGAGRAAFRIVGAGYWDCFPRRRDVAERLERKPMTADAIAYQRAHYAEVSA